MERVKESNIRVRWGWKPEWFIRLAYLLEVIFFPVIILYAIHLLCKQENFYEEAYGLFLKMLSAVFLPWEKIDG